MAALIGLVRQIFPATVEAEKGQARLRASQHAIFAGEEPPEDEGLLLDTKAVSKLLKLGDRTIYRMSHSGVMPAPIKIGGAVRWSREVIEKWIAEGCQPVEPRGVRRP